MSRRLAQLSQVIRCGHQPTSKKVVPNTVHDHAASNRIVLAKQVFGQVSPTAQLRVVGLRINRLQEAAGDLVAGSLVIPTWIQG